MRIAVLGTGIVGKVLSSRLIELGNSVYMGTRDTSNSGDSEDPKSLANWLKANELIQLVNFEDIPSDCDLYINATGGFVSIEALEKTGKNTLKDKVLLDLANPLDFSKGMPPSLFVSNTDSLGEQIQRAFPDTHVIKSLNTMNCNIMLNPALVQGDHNVFICGNDEKAKTVVKSLLTQAGWKDSNIMDLGDITAARATEMVLPVWLKLWGKLGTANFNFNIVQ